MFGWFTNLFGGPSEHTVYGDTMQIDSLEKDKFNLGSAGQHFDMDSSTKWNDMYYADPKSIKDNQACDRAGSAGYIGSVIKTGNESECAENCSKNGECVGFSYSKPKQECYLQNENVFNSPVKCDNGYSFMLRERVEPFSEIKGALKGMCVTEYDENAIWPGDQSEPDNRTRWCSLGVRNCKDEFCKVNGETCKNQCAMGSGEAAGESMGKIGEAVGTIGGIDSKVASILCYGNMHSDLKEKICEGGCVNEAHSGKLMQHFVDHGMKENRVFCTPQITKEVRADLTRDTDIPAIKEGYRVEPFQRRYKRGAIRGMQI